MLTRRTLILSFLCVISSIIYTTIRYIIIKEIDIIFQCRCSFCCLKHQSNHNTFFYENCDLVRICWIPIYTILNSSGIICFGNICIIFIISKYKF